MYIEIEHVNTGTRATVPGEYWDATPVISINCHACDERICTLLDGRDRHCPECGELVEDYAVAS